jgi:predicted nuclease with RNAse H fold
VARSPRPAAAAYAPVVSQTTKSRKMPSHPDLLGIDAGLTLLHRTSGVCRTGISGDLVDHTYIDLASRLLAVAPVVNYSVLAIDAPVLSGAVLNYEVRACEKVFVWAGFQKRCKPGESHVGGTGQALRRAGVETARAFAPHVTGADLAAAIPRVIEGHNIVEAFPNAFLGVCVADGRYATVPERGEKTDWLYEAWSEDRVVQRLRDALSWERPAFWQRVAENQHHDERAALVCAMTSICVCRGEYVAVGEPTGGYFFLPPWKLWAPWARTALDANRRDSRLVARVEVWIDGECHGPNQPLPEIAG